MQRWHGRQLKGFGNIDESRSLTPGGYSGSVGNDPKYFTSHLKQLEQSDDVFGSGIFDGVGHSTANADTGIFASAYSLPGYVGREVPYAVS